MHPGWNLVKWVMPKVKLKQPIIISKFMGILVVKNGVKTNCIWDFFFLHFHAWFMHFLYCFQHIESAGRNFPIYLWHYVLPMFIWDQWLGHVHDQKLIGLMIFLFCSVFQSSIKQRKQTKLTRSILHSQKGVCFVAYYHMCLSIFKY